MKNPGSNLLQNKFYQLFLDELREIYSAENQIIEAFPRLLNCISSDDLKNTLKSHSQETQNQKRQLEKIFQKLDERPEGKTSDGIRGILKECDKVLEKHQPSLVEDAALIATLQKIMHYEIATFGTLRSFAKHLELREIENILQQLLDEEAKADKKLTKVAEGGFFSKGINAKAAA